MKNLLSLIIISLYSTSLYSADCDRNLIRDDLANIVLEYVIGSERHPLRSVLYKLENNELEGPYIDIKSTEQERVASSQKIVTAYLLYKNRSKINYPIRMSRGAHRIAREGENLDNWNRLIARRSLSEQKLFEAILNLSSNGASYRALEMITNSSSESRHASFINEFIDQAISENTTHFTNAHGLDNYSFTTGLQKNFTNARDMAKMARHIYTDYSYRQFLSRLGFSNNYFSKTGSTRAAGKNNIVLAKVLKSSSLNNCINEEFILFYSGQTHTGARDKILEYFGNSSSEIKAEVE